MALPIEGLDTVTPWQAGLLVIPGYEAEASGIVPKSTGKVFNTNSRLIWIASLERGGAAKGGGGVQPDDTTYGRRQAAGVVSVG